jgi:protein O-mannosyl-transferase
MPAPSSANPKPLFPPSAAVTAALLVALVALAYWGALASPFLFDDADAVVNNPTLRSGLLAALAPPADGSAVTGRPLVNLSFALDRALFGEGARGFHATNLALHALATLTLFGLVRRVL